MAPDSPFFVTVAIPTYRRHGPARRLAEQALAEPHGAFEVLIVDQTPGGSPDLEELGRRDRRARYVFESRPGLPGARNVAAREARGDILLFLDDDMSIEPGLIARHARHYADPTILGVAGRITGGYEAASGDGRAGYLRPWDLKIVRNFGGATACDVEFLPGGNFSIRREAVAAVGGFDARFGGTAVGEETDFFLRARAWAREAGRPSRRYVYDPEAAVIHHWLPAGGCRLEDGRAWAYWIMHNVMLFGLRHGAWPAVAVLLLKRTARAASFAAAYGSFDWTLAALKGLLDGMGTFARSGARRYVT